MLVSVCQNAGFEHGSMNEARCNTIGAFGGGVYICRPGSVGAIGYVAGPPGFSGGIIPSIQACLC